MPLFPLESLSVRSSTIRRASSIITVGIDEAGRGALAGPVVAAACVLLKKAPVRIGDSKQLSPEEREASFEWIIQHCCYGVGMVEAHEIDSIGILAATELAMQQAVRTVAQTHPKLYLLVDGRDAFWFDHPHSSIIRGDASEPCIGAASIIAKVTRDRLMVKHANRYKKYNLAQHKGYGTPEHFAALKKHGLCALHRKSFVKNILHQTLSS